MGDLYEIIGGGTPSTSVDSYWRGDIPWISSADIYGLKDIRPRKKITKDAVEKSATNIVPENSIIVVTRVGLGKVAIAPFSLCFSQDSQALVAEHTFIDPLYAVYYLSQAVQRFKQQHQGTTIAGVTKKQVKELPFPLPPLGEQRRIVSRIEQLFTQIDEGVRYLQQAQTQLEQYKQATLQSAFTKAVFDITVNDVSSQIQYGTSEKADSEPSGIPVLRMGNLQDMSLDFSNLKYMPREWDHPELILEDGDVLFNRTNSAELVGKTAVYKKTYPKATFASYLIRVKVNREKYNSDLLSYYINSKYGRKYIKSVVSQQVGQANVNGTKLGNMPIPNIPLNQQNAIIEKINSVIINMTDINNEIQELIDNSNQLKRTILYQAFQGYLAPQDPSDEPASVLLERIKTAHSTSKVSRGRRKVS